MPIVERSKNLMMSAGAGWVMWLLIGLSIISIAIIIERLLALRALYTDMESLRSQVVAGLREGGFAKVRELLAGLRHPAARVVARVVAHSESDTTVKEAEEAMAAESLAQKRMLERRFSFLATLGANAPFIGLFGTVVGILEAFDALGHASATQGAGAVAPQAVMSSIAEALVATAIGLAVAIPAVFAYNMFQKTVKAALDDAQMLSLEVLSYLQSRGVHTASPREVPARGNLMHAPAVALG